LNKERSPHLLNSKNDRKINQSFITNIEGHNITITLDGDSCVRFHESTLEWFQDIHMKNVGTKRELEDNNEKPAKKAHKSGNTLVNTANGANGIVTSYQTYCRDICTVEKERTLRLGKLNREQVQINKIKTYFDELNIQKSQSYWTLPSNPLQKHAVKLIQLPVPKSGMISQTIETQTQYLNQHYQANLNQITVDHHLQEIDR
jgi:hypothetical protein